MSNNRQWLYLISSNASKEYIQDALETLALPIGVVQHYRYQLKWLGQNLKDILPVKIDPQSKLNNNDLKGIRVLANYLYQCKKGDNWIWKAIYPTRFGTLMNAYKTGTEDFDIAHFYFKVEEHLHFDATNEREDFLKLMEEKSKRNSKNTYAFLGESFDYDMLSAAKDKEDKSAFHETCENFDLGHFGDPKNESVKYIPIFCYIEGVKYIKCKKEMILNLEYEPLYHRSSYEFVEGNPYAFEFAVYSKEKPPEYSVKLSSDKKLFSNPFEYGRKSDCRYDEVSFVLVPSLIERDVSSELAFELGFDEKLKFPKGIEPLNMRIIFGIKVIRNINYRMVDATGEVGFGVGTGLIVFFKMLENELTWWYWPVIVCYGIWIACVYTKKLWKIKRR